MPLPTWTCALNMIDNSQVVLYSCQEWCSDIFVHGFLLLVIRPQRYTCSLHVTSLIEMLQNKHIHTIPPHTHIHTSMHTQTLNSLLWAPSSKRQSWVPDYNHGVYMDQHTHTWKSIIFPGNVVYSRTHTNIPYQNTSDVILNMGFGYFVSMHLGFDYFVSIHMQVCSYDAHSSTLLNV